MSVKYHINPETGNPNKCTATVRGCKFAQGNLIPEHYDTKEEAKKSYEKSAEKKFKKSESLSNSNKARYEKIKQTSVNKKDDSEFLKSIRNIEPASYAINLNIMKGYINSEHFDYDWSYEYGEDGSETIDPEYTELNEVNVESLADEITSYNYTDKNEVIEILKKNGADDVNNYSININDVGYGVDVNIEFHNESAITKDLEKFYYAKNNAVDKDGVLEYVRSKGVATKGLTPIEALKEQLKQENPGRSSSYVDKATSVSSRLLNVNEIKVGAVHRLDNVKAHEPESFNGSKEVAGVVYYDMEHNIYRLIDGYHRMKFLKGEGSFIANYVIIN